MANNGNPRSEVATKAEWTRRAEGPTLFRRYGGGIGSTSRSWRVLNVGGESQGLLVRFSGSFFSVGNFTPTRAAIALGPRLDSIYDNEGNYRAKTLVFADEREDIDPEFTGDAWQIMLPDLRIPAGYVAATDQRIKRRISVKDIDQALQQFDEPILDIALHGDWETSEGEVTLEIFTGRRRELAYSSTEQIRRS